MKNKEYCVTYSSRTYFDATIVASNKEAAEKKVKDVLGDVRFEGTWEIKRDGEKKKA